MGFVLNHDAVWVVDEELEADLQKGGEIGALALVSVSNRELKDNELQFAFLKSGVVIHRERFVLRFELAVTVFLSADGLRTDLSGFCISDRELMLERCTQARDRLVNCLKSRAEESEFLLPGAVHGFPTREVGKGLLGYVTVATLFAGPAGFALTAVHGLAVASMAKAVMKVNELLVRRLRKKFPISPLLAKLEKVRIGPLEHPPQSRSRRPRKVGRSWESERWGGR